ncbi:MAG: hypothetical protein K9K65_10185 [Desulfarculaceae bacterium]|nr:hypothetical protein [Desulfarculaceae bacterium]MCF8048824.1 hypothetical protein [Desulfarculaceae bacterium]MCF8065394.1 hypothetical protein [Desulfarculaceae bacterium]MCF8098199.1 hypothetical protein [Desulfarculaceae bacterium]MCF8123183.1 hypothetical protein [Desulfarculaceae bacterium]
MKKFAAVMGLALALMLPSAAALASTDIPFRPAPADRPVAVTKPSGPVKPGQVNEAAFWTSRDGKTRLFLVRTEHGKFALFVAGGQGLTVAYHTRRNSSQDVTLELKPVQGSGGCLREYRFSHTFSRTTIWMALEFAEDGKPLPELKRSFMNGIRPGLL